MKYLLMKVIAGLVFILGAFTAVFSANRRANKAEKKELESRVKSAEVKADTLEEISTSRDNLKAEQRQKHHEEDKELAAGHRNHFDSDW